MGRVWKETKSETLDQESKNNVERETVEELRAKSEEKDRDWYKFLREEGGSEQVNVEELVISGRNVKEESESRGN